MKRHSLIFLIGGCVLTHAGPASAETRQFANLVYELPTGWQPNGKSDGRQERPTFLRMFRQGRF